MPNNTSLGMIIGVAGTLLGLALVFYIWWLVVVAAGIIVVSVIARSFVLKTTHIIPADEIAAEHRAWLAQVRAATAITRDAETSSANHGLATLELPAVEGVAT